MSDLIMKVKRNSAGAPDFSTAVEIEPKEYDPCGTCKHNGKSWHEEPCDGCCGNHSGYEPIGDLISRQGTLAKIRTRLQDWTAYGNEEYRRGLYACEDMILSLPSAEPKTGKWVDCGMNADGTHNIKCDQCGAGFRTRGHANSHYTKERFKWCPTCGARMRGEEE